MSTETTTPEPQSYEITSYCWDLYRRSQEIPWPMIGGGEVLKAQSRLWHVISAPACETSAEPADPAQMTVAVADLIAAVRRYCGDDAAVFVTGQEGRAAA